MSATCPLCGLRYAGQSLLDLHIREDHAQRERGREPPATPADPPATEPGTPAAMGDPSATEPGTPAGPAGLPGWAAAARRALSRLTRAGRETADRARKAA